ncbi:YcgJ family protein [Enterobacter hormaechei]|nr:YcgJ family protein [Enterobacter hormaechei]
MKKIINIIVLLGMTFSVFAANIFSPAGGVVCDKKAGFCVNRDGISRTLTAEYMEERINKLDEAMGDGLDVDTGKYTLSNGVFCDSAVKQCYTDRYYPQTPDKKEMAITNMIFGKPR